MALASPLDTTTVTQASTLVIVTASPDPTVFGQADTLTATVIVAAPGAGSPTGTVSFFDGATLLGAGTVDSGVASVTISDRSVGTHPITAVYGGDGNFTGNTSPVDTTTVTQANTTVSLAAAPDPSVFGQPVTYSALVIPTAPARAM